MKVAKLIIFAALNIFIPSIMLYGQDLSDTFDEIKIYIDSNSRKVYYEGESPSFLVRVDNLSRRKKKYHRFYRTGIVKVREEGGTDILRMPRYRVRDTHSTGDPLAFEKRAVKHPVMPYFKFVQPHHLGFDYFGNIDITHYIPLSDADKEDYIRKPLFLKPGKYSIIVQCTLYPTLTVIETTYDIEVIEAEGRIREQLMNYLKAMDYTIRHGRLPDIKYVTSETEGTLWKVLKEDINTPYANDIVRLMAFELDFSLFCIRNYREDKLAAFPLLEHLPNMTQFNSIDVAATFYEFNVHKIAHLHDNGLIPDVAVYVDNYLRRIAHLDPYVSEQFIKTSDYYLKVPRLRNYAKERVEAMKYNIKGK